MIRCKACTYVRRGARRTAGFCSGTVRHAGMFMSGHAHTNGGDARMIADGNTYAQGTNQMKTSQSCTCDYHTTRKRTTTVQSRNTVPYTVHTTGTPLYRTHADYTILAPALSAPLESEAVRKHCTEPAFAVLPRVRALWFSTSTRPDHLTNHGLALLLLLESTSLPLRVRLTLFVSFSDGIKHNCERER